MVGRKPHSESMLSGEAPRGFDDFELRLGDVMRGERATLGKSLLDVQRELRIKASYIAAIENCDPSAFDTPGFIAGYVRSYARYLGMDPDETFAAFCRESGFSVAHGMSERASVVKKRAADAAPKPQQAARDPFKQPALPFAPDTDGFLSRIEPGAVGSMLVLIALISGIGYGGWTVLQEVQRVQVTPVEQTPIVLSDLDPVQTTRPAAPEEEAEAVETAGVFTPPSNEALDRLYRPQALDVPVLVARDAPISTLDPSRVGAFAQARQTELPNVQPAGSAADAVGRDLAGQFAGPPDASAFPGGAPGVALVAVRPAWVRVTSADGRTLYEGIMDGGDTWTPPPGAGAPVLQVGESGAMYFAVNGRTYGPAGDRGAVTSGLTLSPDVLTERYALAVPASDDDLGRVLATLRLDQNTTVAEAGPRPEPKVLADGAPGVTVVAVQDAWVRVRDAQGATLYEATMRAGDTFQVPQTENPATIRTGNAGAIYFAANGQTYGPYGSRGAIADNLALTVADVTTALAAADPAQDAMLAKVVAELTGPAGEGVAVTTE
ncbi:helix-turn-helix domain-containing protein [Roseivivax isoporae]|uniref:Cytoskeleton protein RodZ-like C-terminal domain-containing protein n=1 Tax=Roseivivax isoporae LMG 25204 TaxID=1449351 RepID=X7F889_9RHOB|nr:helix-turn-helix domain-containing protein [Roseivivax isoporae]ETX29107.1 hypothetical protein RISW2_02765 [Roseivivax isoporae LMG 25204]